MMKTVSLRTTLKALLCSALLIPMVWHAGAHAADDKISRGHGGDKHMSRDERAAQREAWHEHRQARWAEREEALRADNPVLAAELDALRVQRREEGPRALRRMDRETFRDTYPELNETIEQGLWAQRLSGRGPMMSRRHGAGRHHRER